MFLSKEPVNMYWFFKLYKQVIACLCSFKVNDSCWFKCEIYQYLIIES